MSFNEDPDLLKTVIIGDETWGMAMILQAKPINPILLRLRRYKKSKQELYAIPEGAFQKRFEYWKKRWHKCIISEGSCFEGDKIVIEKYFMKKFKITVIFYHISYESDDTTHVANCCSHKTVRFMVTP